MNRFSFQKTLAGCLVVAAVAGCVKQVPAPDLGFEATQRVSVTFRGGEQIAGKIATGKRVELKEPGVIWAARVGEVSGERIVLKDLIRLRETDGVKMQVARAQDSRLRVSESAPDKVLLRGEITRVELLKTDMGRTARQASFWAYGAVVLTLLLGDRS